MINRRPKVSIIMPVYNPGKFLVLSIESVLNQTYSNFEFIIVDDVSTDGSWKILTDYAKINRKIKLFRNRKNSGISVTAKKAILNAQGDFIARMDSDDIMPFDRIAKQIQYLTRYPNVVVVGGQVELINKDGLFIANKNFPKDHKDIVNMAFTAMPIQQGAMMVNKKLLPKNFTWYKNYLNTSEDLDFFMRAFQYGKAANLESICLYYRQHGQSLTQAENPKEIFYQAYKVRQFARKKYDIHPKLATLLLLYVQYALVVLLPTSLIYPLYYIWRGIRPLKSGRNGYQALFKHALSYV